LNQALIVDDVFQLGEEIRTAAAELSADLKSWAEELQDRAQAFDVPGMRALLREFVQVVGSNDKTQTPAGKPHVCGQ
jgi:hypothetical protein